MKKLGRGEFIRKNLLGGAALAAGVPLLSSFDTPEDLKVPENYEDINWKKIRKQFSLPKGFYYFNSAGLGIQSKAVLETVYENMQLMEQSVSHLHHEGLEVNKQLARFLNAEPEEIAITRNATEGMNIIARSIDLKEGDEVILTSHEHVGGLFPWIALKDQIGITITIVDLDIEGVNNYDLIGEAITDKTKVISFSHVTCTNGMILPAKAIAKSCKERGIYCCIDGAQALGMIPINLKDIDADFYTASGHKWAMGPKETGVLYINKRNLEKTKPIFAGAYTDSGYDLNKQHLNYRNTAEREEYGTRNGAIKLGLGKAVQMLETIGMDNIAKRERELANYFFTELGKNKKVEFITPKDQKFSAAIVSFRIKNKDYNKVVRHLNENTKVRVRGIYENNLNAIRVSFGIHNSMDEVDYLIEQINIL